MLRLLIDNQPVTLQSGQNIKLTRENPFFASSGDYTLDVTLPLAGHPQNQRALGTLHRHETNAPRQSLRHDFQLLADGLQLRGRARVTQADQDKAKLQLLAGASALGVDCTDDQGDDIYIDQLELGFAYDNILATDRERFTPQYADPTDPVAVDAEYAWRIASWLNGAIAPWPLADTAAATRPEGTSAPSLDTLTPQQSEVHMHGSRAQTPYTCFPLWLTTQSEQALNRHVLYRTADSESGHVGAHYRYGFDFAFGTEALQPIACQPYLWTVAERLLAALPGGYQLDTTPIADHWISDIVILGTSRSIRTADQLPHWTAREFLQEVRSLTGTYFTVDGRRVTVHPDATATTLARPISLPGPLAAHTLETPTPDSARQAQKDNILTANIAYALPEGTNPLVHIPESVWQKALIREFPTMEALQAWADQQTADEKSRSRYLLVDTATAHTYAFLPDPPDSSLYFLRQIDILPTLVRPDQFSPTDRTPATELRIIPCPMELKHIPVREGAGSTSRSVPLPQPQLDDSLTRRRLQEDEYSVADHLLPDEDADTDTDTTTQGSDTDARLAVAYRSPHRFDASIDTHGQPLLYPARAVALYGQGYTPDAHGYLQPVSLQEAGAGQLDPDRFALTSKTSPHASAATLGLDTATQLTIQYTGPLTDPTRPVRLAGRHYLIRKLELTLTDTGIHPLKTATLAPMDATTEGA